MSASPAFYAFGGQVISSMFALPELAAAASGQSDWHVAMADEPTAFVAPWFHHWQDARGRRWLSFGRMGDGYVLRFTRLGGFRVSLRSRAIVCERRPAVPADTRRHLLLNQVLPLALGTERLVLHASAVAAPHGVVAFAGPGGAGKSTLAAALARRGHPVLADDAVAVSEIGGEGLAHPSFPSVRLWSDSMEAVLGARVAAPRAAHYTSKRRLAASLLPMTDTAAPLRAVLLLDGPRSGIDGIRLTRLRPRDALARLLPVVFQLDVRDPVRLRATVNDLAALVERVPVIAASYPRKLSALPLITEAIERLVLDGSRLQTSGVGLQTSGLQTAAENTAERDVGGTHDGMPLTLQAAHSGAADGRRARRALAGPCRSSRGPSAG